MTGEMEDSGKEDIMDRAIRDCVDRYHGDIINMSWTLNQEKDELHDAVKYAQEKGAILVAAAGNLSMQTPLGSLVYPAAWEEVIGVGGVDLDEKEILPVLCGISKVRLYLSVQMAIIKGKRDLLLQYRR